MYSPVVERGEKHQLCGPGSEIRNEGREGGTEKGTGTEREKREITQETWAKRGKVRKRRETRDKRKGGKPDEKYPQQAGF